MSQYEEDSIMNTPGSYYFGAISQILNAAECRPDDSLMVIANEAFEFHGIPLVAEWSEEDNLPVNLCYKKLAKDSNE